MNKKYLQYVNKIIDFYREHKLNAEFENGFFKEGNSETMVLQRLERAVKDEVEGNLHHSRYAIWASSLNDLISNALEGLKDNDTTKALNQLQIASNSLKAFKDTQTIFSNDFYQVRDLFRAYAKHLLSVEDRLSNIISSKEILNKLRVRTEISGIRLPNDIELSVKNGVLKVYINKPDQNMQNDSAAFESWIVALKAWLPDEIKYVELDFTFPSDMPALRCGDPRICHYNRFLYRINNFKRLFPDWFFLNDGKIHKVKDFVDWLKKEPCLLNHSLRERVSVINTTKMERQIESWLVFEDGKEQLCALWDLDREKLFNQLPVGLFHQEIASKNAIFTRGAGAIDIWGISKDGETLHLIELKYGDNKSMGVISEALFYTAVLYDTCVATDSLFVFGKYGNTSDTKDKIAIQNDGKKFKWLNSHFLAERYHPLFSDEVMDLLTDGLSNIDVKLDRTQYSYQDKTIINLE